MMFRVLSVCNLVSQLYSLEINREPKNETHNIFRSRKCVLYMWHIQWTIIIINNNILLSRSVDRCIRARCGPRSDYHCWKQVPGSWMNLRIRCRIEGCYMNELYRKRREIGQFNLGFNCYNGLQRILFCFHFCYTCINSRLKYIMLVIFYSRVTWRAQHRLTCLRTGCWWEHLD
jgi:hypothetical protein